MPSNSHNAQDAGDSEEHASVVAIQERAAYLELAQTQRLGLFANRSWELYTLHPYERMPPQGAPDIVEAYIQARRLAPAFEVLVTDLARDLHVRYRVRPGGIKDANRALEKMGSRQKAVPLDLLGGTLICSTVDSMYWVAEHLCAHPSGAFTVVGFRDRCLVPVPTGYRDLQLTVLLADGHLAELKVLHDIISNLDRHEHKLFEIQRSLETANRQEMSFVDDLVSTILTEASREMYTQAWERVLKLEALRDQEGDE